MLITGPQYFSFAYFGFGVFNPFSRNTFVKDFMLFNAYINRSPKWRKSILWDLLRVLARWQNKTKLRFWEHSFLFCKIQQKTLNGLAAASASSSSRSHQPRTNITSSLLKHHPAESKSADLHPEEDWNQTSASAEAAPAAAQHCWGATANRSPFAVHTSD